MTQKRFYKPGELSGKLVVDHEGMIVGKIRDIAVSSEGKMGIAITSAEGQGLEEKIVFFDEISVIGDVVLLKASKETPDVVRVQTVSDDKLSEMAKPSLPQTLEREKICSKCGLENRAGVDFCTRCGSQLTVSRPAHSEEGHTEISRAPISDDTESETCLGGFSSSWMHRGWMAYGYGIYATNKRIVGTRFIKGLLLQGVLGQNLLGSAITSKFGRDESNKTIKELEEKKDFDIAKDQISKIELRKGGYVSEYELRIMTKAGTEFKICTKDKGDFERLKDLMLLFLPKAVTVLD